MTPGQRIELRRKQLQLSQGDLAALVKTQQNQISRIELGAQPGRKHLAAIAEKLQVPVSWITTGIPLQAWEWQSDSGALRTTVVGIISRLQEIVSDLDRAIAPSGPGHTPDVAPTALESGSQRLADGVRRADVRESVHSSAEDRPESRRRRHRRRDGVQ